MSHKRGFQGTIPSEQVRPKVRPIEIAPDLERLVLCVISREMVSSRAKNPGNCTRLCQILAHAAQVGIFVDGKLQDPPFPEIPEGPWPTHPRVLRRLGLSQAEMRKQFKSLERGAGARAHFPADLVDEFVPEVLWRMLAHLILAGRKAAGARADAAVEHYRQTPVAANRWRAAGAPAEVTVLHQVQAFTRLFKRLVELARREDLSTNALADWDAMPELEVPDFEPITTTTGTPSQAQIRIAWAKVDGEIKTRLRLRPGESELEAIADRGVSNLTQSGVLPRLRDRAALLLVVFTGARPDAVASLKRSDLRLDHEGPPPDRRRGAAIAVRPGKSLHPDLVRLKPITAEAAAMLEAYLLALDKVAEANRRWHWARAKKRIPVPVDPPLLVSDGINYRPLGMDGLSRRFSGVLPGSGRKRSLPFASCERGFNEEIPEELRKWIGYPTRSWRHAAKQLAEAAGRIWNEENPPAPGAPMPDPGLFAEALIDHKSARDELRMRYGDWKTQDAYEIFSGRAIDVMWRLVTTDEGLRRQPDLDQIRATGERLRAVRSHISYEREKADKLYASSSRALTPRLVLQSPALEDPDATRRFLEHLVLQNDRLQEGQEQLARLMTEQHRVVDHIGRMREVEGELVAELSALRHDRRRWKAVPDDAELDSCAIDLELEIDRALTDGRIEEVPAIGAPVRGWLLVSELAQILEVGRLTVNRWINDELPQDRLRQPWEPGNAPVDTSLGLKYRRIWAGGIDAGFWLNTALKDRVAEVLSSWPKGQGWTRNGEPGPRCLAPFVAPDGEVLLMSSGSAELENPNKGDTDG